MKSTQFSKVLKNLAKLSPDVKLRAGFNLWQLVNDLQKQGKNYEVRKTNTSRATA